MSHRIAPRDTSPTHDVEVGYFNELMINVKRMKYGLALESKYPLIMLVYYGLHYQHIAQCAQYNGNLQQLAKEQSPHHDALKTIDYFVSQLMMGLHEGDPVRHITDDVIAKTEKALWEIRDCLTCSAWYR